MGVTVRSLTDEEKQQVKLILHDLSRHFAACEQCQESASELTKMCGAGLVLYTRWLAWLE